MINQVRMVVTGTMILSLKRNLSSSSYILQYIKNVVIVGAVVRRGGDTVDGNDGIPRLYGTNHRRRTIVTNHLLDAPGCGIDLQSDRTRIECDRIRRRCCHGGRGGHQVGW